MLISITITIAGSSEKPWKIIQASEIQGRIRAVKPVEYDHVIIEGDLYLPENVTAVNHSVRFRF